MCPRCESEKYGPIAVIDVPGSDEKITVYECDNCLYTES